MSDKYIPKIAGFYLDIQTIRDVFEPAIVTHEYLLSNRNSIENLGQKTRKISVVCSFQDNPALTKGWNAGDAFFPTYESHFNFLKRLKASRDLLSFTHPKYGEIEGAAKNISVYQDDTINFAQISFDFLQQISTDEITFVRYIVPQQFDGFRKTNTKLTGVIESAQKNAASALQFAGTANLYRGKLDSFLSDITSPATSIMNTINYGTQLPGLIMQSINGAIDRVVQSFVSIRNSPASFINNMIVGIRGLKAIFSGTEAQYVHVMGASRVAYESGVVYNTDDANREEVAKKENIKTFDAAGNYKGDVAIPETMTINELEDTLYQIREFINEVIQFDRDNQDLKQQAADLQNYINTIKLDRERIETKEIPIQTMHTIAMENGLSYQAAERILSLNPGIKNPTFANGEIKILIPASV